MRQSIRYTRSADGTALAWAESGSGPVLVKAGNWLTQIDYDLQSPVWSHWVRFFSDHFRLVRYDERGCGLSDRDPSDLTFERWFEDLEAVVAASAPSEPFALLGISQGAAVALAYAARYPERVSRLILYGGYMRGWRQRGDAKAAELYDSILRILELGWDLENPVFRQIFTARFVPGASDDQMAWFNDLCRKTLAPDMIPRLLSARSTVDVSHLVPRVAIPTLVVHAANDEVVPVSEGQTLAQGIRGAEYVVLDSRNHILLRHEPAWAVFKSAVLDYCAENAGPAPGLRASLSELSDREREILLQISDAKSNPEIARALNISEKTVRNHASNIFRKLDIKSRSEAVLYMHKTR